MTTLLTFRDSVKAFFGRYDFIFAPIVKGVIAYIIFISLNAKFGYFAFLDNRSLIIMIALICAFLPTEVITAIGGVMIALQSFKVAIDVGLLSVAIILIFYCAYMRFAPKTGIIVLFVPLCYSLHLTYALPILLGFLVGPAAIIPTIFGFVLYYYEQILSELVKVLAAATEDDEAVSGFQYVINEMISNKEMILIFAVFSLVILITYAIYRLSFEHSWAASFIVGGFFNIALFLVGNVLVLVDVDIVPVVTGSIIGILLSFVIQFFKGVVDYQRTELLQFEDNEYYYYVKAVPKLYVSESNKNVKKINSNTGK